MDDNKIKGVTMKEVSERLDFKKILNEIEWLNYKELSER